MDSEDVPEEVETERQRVLDIIAARRQRMDPMLYIELRMAIESGLTVEEWTKLGSKPPSKKKPKS